MTVWRSLTDLGCFAEAAYGILGQMLTAEKICELGGKNAGTERLSKTSLIVKEGLKCYPTSISEAETQIQLKITSLDLNISQLRTRLMSSNLADKTK